MYINDKDRFFYSYKSHKAFDLECKNHNYLIKKLMLAYCQNINIFLNNLLYYIIENFLFTKRKVHEIFLIFRITNMKKVLT